MGNTRTPFDKDVDRNLPRLPTPRRDAALWGRKSTLVIIKTMIKQIVVSILIEININYNIKILNDF